jgi:hypothetical protein
MKNCSSALQIVALQSFTPSIYTCSIFFSVCILNCCEQHSHTVIYNMIAQMPHGVCKLGMKNAKFRNIDQHMNATCQM